MPSRQQPESPPATQEGSTSQLRPRLTRDPNFASSQEMERVMGNSDAQSETSVRSRWPSPVVGQEPTPRRHHRPWEDEIVDDGPDDVASTVSSLSVSSRAARTTRAAVNQLLVHLTWVQTAMKESWTEAKAAEQGSSSQKAWDELKWQEKNQRETLLLLLRKDLYPEDLGGKKSSSEPGFKKGRGGARLG